MNNFMAAAYHPVEKVIRLATFMGNYFGNYAYGVRFDEGGPVFTAEETDIPHDVVFVPRAEE